MRYACFVEISHPVGGKYPCPTLYVPGIVCESPVLAAGCNLLRRVVDGDDASAGERSDIRAALLVERDVPCGDGTSPVIEDARCIDRPTSYSRFDSRAD